MNKKKKKADDLINVYFYDYLWLKPYKVFEFFYKLFFFWYLTLFFCNYRFFQKVTTTFIINDQKKILNKKNYKIRKNLVITFQWEKREKGNIKYFNEKKKKLKIKIKMYIFSMRKKKKKYFNEEEKKKIYFNEKKKKKKKKKWEKEI
jgi:hypothetical protein